MRIMNWTRAMAQFEAQGFDCRRMNEEEEAEHNRLVPDPEPVVYEQLSLAKRIQQMKRVRHLVYVKKIAVRAACQKVGIGYENYKSVRCAHRKGLTKRP
jgi:hypothetical protein